MLLTPFHLHPKNETAMFMNLCGIDAIKVFKCMFFVIQVGIHPIYYYYGYNQGLKKLLNSNL